MSNSRDLDPTIFYNLSECFKQTLKGFDDIYSLSEIRIYYELTGKLMESSLKSNTDEEIQILKKALYNGVAHSNFVWPLATSCDQHSVRLKIHLENYFSNIDQFDFVFEEVNSFIDIDESKWIDFNVTNPMANHYLVRAVSKKSGHSYIIDGYLKPSVKLESSLRKRKIIFNEYEECLIPKVMELKGITGGWQVLASFGPVIKTIIGREVKKVAQLCLEGMKDKQASELEITIYESIF